MKRICLILCIAVMFSACHHHTEHHHHEEEEEKALLTAYNDEYELYAESDFLIANQPCNILAHITQLIDFKPYNNKIADAYLVIGGKKAKASVETSSTPGIFHIVVTPPAAGSGELVITLPVADSTSQLHCEIQVCANEETADEYAESTHVHSASAISFSKEQSWKTDFATAFPSQQPFGQVIPVVAQVQTAPGNEMMVVAQSSGIVSYVAQNLFEGKEVTKGTSLVAIHSENLIDDNLTVRLNEAKNNYESAKDNYERAKSLINNKIVSEREYIELKNAYENSKLIYENLQKNVSKNGSTVTAPMSGFVQQIFVQNGEFVTVGQSIMMISQTQNVVIKADVPQRYGSVLPFIKDVTVEDPVSHKVYDSKELDCKILSYGKSVSSNSFMLPVSLQVNNIGAFTAGGFVKIWLKATTNEQALLLPKSALIEEQGNFFVFEQLTPELFEKREVKIGATDGKMVEILSGITQEQRIVVRGAIMVNLSKASGALDPHAGHVH